MKRPCRSSATLIFAALAAGLALPLVVAQQAAPPPPPQQPPAQAAGRGTPPPTPPRGAPTPPAGLEGLRLVAGLQPVREAIRFHRSALQRVALEQKDSPTLEALARFATDQGVPEVVRSMA